MRYFYTDTNRRPQGPESREKILELLGRGVINSASLVAEEGGTAWQPVSSLSAEANTAPPLPVTATEPLAIWSLALGLISCICCWFGFITAIAGIICGHLARSKIRNNPDCTGAGLALAGLIIGYLVVALSLISFIGVTFFNIWESMSKHL
ncbi:MAG: DUF4190 domain-containing protein [Verrucomicrobiales bacterium]|jgi:hypothetical protein|nr:DUF4190 domain-containing protein [Verrucomicrobiales bacterium]